MKNAFELHLPYHISSLKYLSSVVQLFAEEQGIDTANSVNLSSFICRIAGEIINQTNTDDVMSVKFIGENSNLRIEIIFSEAEKWFEYFTDFYSRSLQIENKDDNIPQYENFLNNLSVSRENDFLKIIISINIAQLTSKMLDDNHKSDRKNLVSFRLSGLFEDEKIYSNILSFMSFAKPEKFIIKEFVLQRQNIETISFIAENDNGEYLGYIAVDFMKDYPARITTIFLNRNIRDCGLLKKMLSGLLKLNEENIYLLRYDSKTDYVTPQKTFYNQGFRETCLLISNFKTRLIYNENIKNKRGTTLVFFYTEKGEKEYELYIPENHKDIVVKIYSQFGIVVHNTDVVAVIDYHKKSEFAVEIDENKCAHIKIIIYGTDITERIELQLKQLCYKRIETVYIYLPLDVYYTKRHSYDFEEMGFFFAGILFLENKRNYLVLQYLNNQVIDYNDIEVYSDLGMKIKNYIKSRDPNQKYLSN